VTSRAATTAASGTESKPATTVSATTSTQAASASQAGTQTTQANATTTRATPDLGSEVFPDARGKAIAKASEAPVIIVPRTDWTVARPDFGHIEAMNGINRITVHHTAGEIQTDAWRPTANELEGIREFHAGTRPTDRNWADIAYHFAIDRAGRVWQARPLAYQGAHAKGHNQHNLGIVLLGNFAVQSPSAAQLTSLTLFVGFVRKLYAVPLANVFTHGELVDTECPGTLLQEFMDRGRKAWGDADGIAWDKVTTHPASDPASTTAAGQ
jgi:N-acetylmuramoyl-L-alanine amidase